MRRQSFGWFIRPIIVVFVIQEIIFITEYLQDIHSIFGLSVGDTSELSVAKANNYVQPDCTETKRDLPITSSAEDVADQIRRMSESFKVRSKGIDCAKIIRGDEMAISRGKAMVKSNFSMPSSDFAMFMQIKYSCSKFIHDSGYILHHVTNEERDFPIAYGLVIYKHFHQVESLMRLIYRPQNFYCIHVDYKAPTHVHIAARNYADCFPNVFVPRDLVDVNLHQVTTVNAHMVCLYELLKYSWKYYISLSGQDYPLKTNRQILRILTAFQGANDIHTKPMHMQGTDYKLRFNAKIPPPHGLRIVRGSGEIVASRAFVEFVASDIRVRDLLTYLNGTRYPAETFWPTVNNDHGLKAPGGFGGSLEEASRKPWIARVRWDTYSMPYCRGHFAGYTCVFGVGDLHNITRGPQIFASKFFWDFQPIALQCLREWMVNKTRDEHLGKTNFDARHYSELPQVQKRNRA